MSNTFFLCRVDAALPPSFDLVVLGKKERAAVIAVGKNPDRKEGDIDANGNPINTAYRGDEELPALPEPAPASTPAPVPALEAAPGGVPEAQMDVSIEADAESEAVPA